MPRVALRCLVIASAAMLLATGCSPEPTPEDPAPTPGRVEPPTDELVWRTGAPMPTERTEVSAALFAGRVYVVGGFTAQGRVSAAVEAYDIAEDAWHQAPSLPHPLHHAALVSTPERLYLIGGYLQNREASADVWTLAEGDEAWQPGPAMPEARGAFAAAVVQGRIHAVGGATAFGGRARLTGAHTVLDPDSGEWETLESLPDPRDHLAAAGIGERLVVVGGRKLSLDSNTPRADVFDAASGTWSRAPDMPTARGGLGAATWREGVWVVGGEEDEGTFAEVEWLDLETGVWHAGPSLPTPRHGLGVVGVPNGELIVVGGGPQPRLSVSGATELLQVR